MPDEARTDDRVAAPNAVIERLEGRVALLEEAMGFAVLTPLEWGLTAHQMRLFGCMMTRELMTTDAAMAALYADRHGAEETPDPKIVDVQICKMRAKLKPFGVEILTRRGQGYYLTAASKADARALMSPVAA